MSMLKRVLEGVLVETGEELFERAAPHVEEAVTRRRRGDDVREILHDALRKLEDKL